MRKTFIDTLSKLAEEDNSIVLITGDVEHCVTEFKKKFKERYFNIGICEQSMIGISAGLALGGMKPYVYSITPFLIERAFEQVKLDIDGQNVNVKLIGYSNYPKAGISHNEINAKKLMDMFKNIQSYFPEDKVQLEKYLGESYESNKPSFIRLTS
jgi:transketolase